MLFPRKKARTRNSPLNHVVRQNNMHPTLLLFIPDRQVANVAAVLIQNGVKRSVTRLTGGSLGYAQVIAIKVC